MIKLLVIADDFTGAPDTGVQFSRKKIPTLVSKAGGFGSEDVLHKIEKYQKGRIEC